MATNLFVSGVSQRISPREVEDKFNKYGRCRVDMKQGFCFVEYDDSRDAADAKDRMNGKEMDGRVLHMDIDNICVASHTMKSHQVGTARGIRQKQSRQGRGSGAL